MVVGFGFFGLFFVVMMLLVVVPFAFWIFALVDVARAPDAAFGPPGDNGKTMWILGLALSALIPAGALVTTVLWWVQGRGPLRAGRPVPRPFWAPRPTVPVGYPVVPPYQQAPPQPPGTPHDRPPQQ